MSKALLVAATLAGCTASSSTRTTAGRQAETVDATAAPRDSRLAQATTDGRPSTDAPASRRASLAEDARAARAWRTAYDWDGDGVKDEVVSELTGGAHCCYRVGVKLAARSKPILLPFMLDGGYAYPEDLPSNPERFSVVTAAGRLPEMVMEIQTYNGEPAQLKPSWARIYGVTSHRIAVSFPGGRVRVRNVGPRPSKR